MTRYKVTLEYDGTNLIGWQENRQGPSVQSLLCDAIEKFCGVRPNIVISEYNENGKCKCLSCSQFATWCQTCEWRDKLLSQRTSMITNKCMQCVQKR